MISCKNISFAYEGKIVFENLSFSVNKGDYLFVVGENGSGKSTLIKGLLGLKKPLLGEINCNTAGLGYVPQHTPKQKDFPASVEEIVLSGTIKTSFPFYTKQSKKKAEENMQKLEILDIKNKCYRELSGGQQQRVLLSRALCATSDLLLLDEPVAGLDPKACEKLYGIIENFNKEHSVTIVMVSHDIQSAVKYASHILHLDKNETFFGSTVDYVLSPLGKRFLGGEFLGRCDSCEYCN